MSAKQDRTYTRTASDLERKFNLKDRFSAVMGVAEDARTAADEALGALVGNNILLGTTGFTGDDWRNLDQWYGDGTFNGFTVKTRIGAWQGVSQYINVFAGEVYTISAYVKSTGRVSFSTDCGGTGTGKATGNQQHNAKPEWTRISNTFTVTETGTIAPGYESGLDTDQLWICGMKIEKGSRATEWCPHLTETAISPESVFNALTNNGQNQGLFRGENGDLYINASFIVSGILASLNGETLFNLETGELATKDPNTGNYTRIRNGGLVVGSDDGESVSVFDIGVGAALRFKNPYTGNTVGFLSGMLEDLVFACYDQDTGALGEYYVRWKTINGVKTLVGEPRR